MSFGRFWRKIVRWFAGGRTESDLAAWLDVPKAELKTGPRHYRRFSIPKRNGGTREILEPNEKLKNIQRRINRRLLRKLPSTPEKNRLLRRLPSTPEKNRLLRRLPSTLEKNRLLRRLPSTLEKNRL